MMLTPRKIVRSPFSLLPSIEAAITEEIAASPRKRGMSPSPAPSLSPSSPPPPPSSPPPSPSSTSPPSLLSSVPPLPSFVMLPPRKRFRMTSPHPKAIAEAIISARLHRKSEACRWTWLQHRIHTWRDQDGAPSTFELGESFAASYILPVMGEPIQHTIPLLMVRLVCHEDQIYEIQEHLEELPLERVESMEHELEVLCARAEIAKQEVETLQTTLGIA
ncbi:hypothetical protein Tco_0303456 [Tanacetum coccineum]